MNGSDLADVRWYCLREEWGSLTYGRHVSTDNIEQVLVRKLDLCLDAVEIGTDLPEIWKFHFTSFLRIVDQFFTDRMDGITTRIVEEVIP